MSEIYWPDSLRLSLLIWSDARTSFTIIVARQPRCLGGYDDRARQRSGPLTTDLSTN